MTRSNLVGSIRVDFSFIPLLIIVESPPASGGDLERGDRTAFFDCIIVALLLTEVIPGLCGTLPAEPPSKPALTFFAGVADAYGLSF